jgi:Mg/Co/Ni transporter MgtE
MIQVYKLKKLNSVLNSEINIGVFVGHIHLNKFLIKLFFTKDKWMGVKLYSCLMVIVCTSKFIS